MCGSGVVALSAKAAGFRTIAGDIAPIGNLAARALIANNDVRLDPSISLAAAIPSN